MGRPHATGITLCVLSACGFGAMGIFGKEAFDAGIGVTTLLALRFTLAAVAFWAVVAMVRPELPRGRLLGAGIAMGAIGYAAQAGLYFAALERIDASLLALLLYVYPAIVVVAAILLGRDQASPGRLAALALAMGGTVLVLAGGATGELDGIGVVMAVGAALVYSTYILVGDRVVAATDPWALAALVATGAATTFLLASLGSGGPDLGFEAAGWAHIGGIALVSTVLPIAAFFAGLRLVGPSTASIVSSAEPAVTVGLAAIVLGETLGPGQIAGGALVLAAVVLLQRRPADSVGADAAAPPAPAAAAARAPLQEPA